MRKDHPQGACDYQIRAPSAFVSRVALKKSASVVPPQSPALRLNDFLFIELSSHEAAHAPFNRKASERSSMKIQRASTHSWQMPAFVELESVIRASSRIVLTSCQDFSKLSVAKRI